MKPSLSLAPYFLIALAFVGLADTAFLSYFEYMNLIPSCAIGGCEIVLTSAYSKFLGVPLAYIGLVYYVYLLALAGLMVLDPASKVLKWAAALYTAIGLLLSIYFEFYIQGVLIGHYCMYCAISALATLALCGVAVWHARKKVVQ
jgi:uncharacterized membrane protein